MSLKTLRKNIDEIDLEIAGLVMRRAKLSEKIGVVKAKAGMPVKDHRREQEVLEKISAPASTADEVRSVKSVFRVILEDSRRLQADAAGRVVETVGDRK